MTYIKMIKIYIQKDSILFNFPVKKNIYIFIAQFITVQ